MRDIDPSGLVDYWGRCPACGKNTYRTRKAARQTQKRTHPGDHMNVYKCESGFGFHYGHLPRWKREGRASDRVRPNDE